MLQALLTVFVAVLIVGGLTVSVTILMKPCFVLSEILADRLSEKFSRNK
jgi:hypothetical protein